MCLKYHWYETYLYWLKTLWTLDSGQWTEGEQGGKLHLLVLMGINYPMPRRRPFRGCAG